MHSKWKQSDMGRVRPLKAKGEILAYPTWGAPLPSRHPKDHHDWYGGRNRPIRLLEWGSVSAPARTAPHEDRDVCDCRGTPDHRVSSPAGSTDHRLPRTAVKIWAKSLPAGRDNHEESRARPCIEDVATLADGSGLNQAHQSQQKRGRLTDRSASVGLMVKANRGAVSGYRYSSAADISVLRGFGGGRLTPLTIPTSQRSLRVSAIPGTQNDV